MMFFRNDTRTAPAEKILQTLRSFFQPNARIVAVSFLAMVLLGALLLKLPWTSLDRDISWTDAFFTATSASCVTGLATVDTGTSFNLLGKGVILFLIQIGGLGIMTLSTLFWISIGHRPGLQSQNLIRETFSPDHQRNVPRIIFSVIRLTLIMEILGALILFLRFSGKMPVRDALGYAVFHSISAFCNAGFSLFPDSMMQYRDDAVVSLTLCVLIIFGGLGFFLATRLYSKGHDVIAIDRNADLVQDIMQQVSRAVTANATDPKALQDIGLHNVDTVIVCMGSALSDSILTTLNLKEIGCKTVYAKAYSEIQGRILEKVGASRVFFPEKDQALQLAEKLHTPNMLDFLPFVDDHTLVHLKTPKDFIGKSLKEMNLINRFGIQILAVQKEGAEKPVMIPRAETGSNRRTP